MWLFPKQRLLRISVEGMNEEFASNLPVNTDHVLYIKPQQSGPLAESNYYVKRYFLTFEMTHNTNNNIVTWTFLSKEDMEATLERVVMLLGNHQV